MQCMQQNFIAKLTKKMYLEELISTIKKPKWLYCKIETLGSQFANNSNPREWLCNLANIFKPTTKMKKLFYKIKVSTFHLVHWEVFAPDLDPLTGIKSLMTPLFVKPAPWHCNDFDKSSIILYFFIVDMQIYNSLIIISTFFSWFPGILGIEYKKR